MKFKTFIAMYKNIIILIWWIAILVIFKITTNFEFSNGNSLIFVGLIVIIPLILYIISLVFKKRLLKKKKKNKKNYFERILNDYQDKTFDKKFLNKLIRLNFIIVNDLEKILLVNDTFEIVFTRQFASINIKETKIIYKYWYTNKFNNINKYDYKYLQYKDTTYLYKLMIERIETLTNNELTYLENKKHCQLFLTKNNELIYTDVKKDNKKEKFKIIRTFNKK